MSWYPPIAMDPLQLRVLSLGAGSVEWLVQAASFTPRTVVHDTVLGLLLVAAPVALLGAGWRLALALGLGAAVALAAARALLAVHAESLTYIRLLGVRLATRRRCGLWSSSHFVPLRQLQGIIIHEEVTPTSVFFFLGLTLCPTIKRSSISSNGSGKFVQGSGGSSGGASKDAAGSGSGSGRRLGSAGGRGSRRVVTGGGPCGGGACEVEVVFPNLRPRLSLLRQVYQQLQPLLQTDIDSIAPAAAGDEQGSEDAARDGRG